MQAQNGSESHYFHSDTYIPHMCVICTRKSSHLTNTHIIAKIAGCVMTFIKSNLHLHVERQEYSIILWDFLISKDWKDLDLLQILGLNHRTSRMSSSPFLSWQLWIQLNLRSDWLKATLRLGKIETISFANIPGFQRFQFHFKFAACQTLHVKRDLNHSRAPFTHAAVSTVSMQTFSMSNIGSLYWK